MFRTQTIPAEYLPPADALPEVFYSLPALNSLPPHLTVAETLIDGALTSGDGERVAYYEGEESITYAELSGRIKSMGNGLRGLGIGLSDRVVLRLDDGVERSVRSWRCSLSAPFLSRRIRCYGPGN